MEITSKTIWDVLIAVIQYGFPILGTVVGVFLGKWLEQKNENKELKREIYLKANRALERFSDFYMTLGAFPTDERVKKLEQERDFLEKAKADLEIFGSHQAFSIYADTLQLAVKCGQEALAKSTQAQRLTNPQTDISIYNKFLETREQWNKTARTDLGLSGS